MIPVEQQLIDSNSGDCMRATVASLLNLPLDAVPNFLLSEELYHDVYTSFFWAHGWNYTGNISAGVDPLPIDATKSINGYFPASVKSYLFNGNTHSVVMDINGVVVHDPSPSKYYQNKKVYGTAELLSWQGFEARGDEFPAMPNYKHVPGKRKIIELEEDYLGPNIDGKRTLVKKGFKCDGGSVPRIFWPCIFHPFQVPFIACAVPHDGDCAAELYERKECDKRLRTACGMFVRAEYKIGRVKRWLIYRAVRSWIGGGRIWKRHTPESIADARKFVECVKL